MEAIYIIFSFLIFNLIGKYLRDNTVIDTDDDRFELMKKIGDIGESRVSNSLNKIVTLDKGRVINNVMLQSKNFSTQIDHIVVGNNNTILLIETKNYKGFITGTVKGECWKQIIGKAKYPFKNPIMQNEYHKKAIETLLKWYKIKDYKIVHIVVFSDDECCLNVESDFVIRLCDLEKTVNKFIRVSENKSNHIYDLINRKNKSYVVGAKEKHSEFVRKRIQKA